MLAALVAWNLGNFLFFIVAGRLLGPEDYGLVAALLAATMLVMVPASAFQYAVARGEGALLVARDPSAGATYRRALRLALIAIPVAGALAAVLLAVVPVQGFPHREAVVTLLVVLPMVPMYLGLGQLQARERFAPFAAATAAIGLPRPVFLPLLAAAGLGVYAALGASALAVALAAAIAVRWANVGAAGAPPSPQAWEAFRRALPPLVVGLSGLALLTNLDIMVAKLALSAQQAGEFGAIAALGKAVVVVPQAVSIVVLPRVAMRRAQGRDTGPLLAAAIGITFAIGAVATLVAWALQEPIVRLTYGAEYADGAHLLAPLVGASTLLGGLIVLLNHHIGRSADAFVWALAGAAALQVALFGAFHGSAGQLVMVDAAACAAALAGHEIAMGRGPDGMVAGLVRLVRSRSRAS